ncbi:Hypothetical Protein FCC1311_003262 [Hondaea fermentalgiana]|uniref:Nucleolar protein Dnt1-like N-terminal domain-containing protein n=1 Tax=Hondaea fermentalgiana TaxID=2315210 RepID=A0A2R5G2Z4_9STRA|nr:Hypothetical Protein FCC1311_003262 [Hondaea fermentalgiana]|eukprot:GBG24108.1 Hypothetical Protein FCC1311_003262 [Hondaea fermentalgiana]
MKIHVHLFDTRFVTSCDRSTTLGELRHDIETQYASLHPRAPPLAAHALQDANGYLLPSRLLVGDVLVDGDKITVVLEKELPPVAQTDIAQVLTRWRYFQRYTLLAIEASLEQKKGLAEGPMLVLLEMLAAEDQSLVEKTCATLCKAVEARDSTVPPLDGTLYGKLLCGLGRETRDQKMQQHCATIIAACLQQPSSVAALEAAGAANTLARLSRSDCQETRALATSALWELSHASTASAKYTRSLLKPTQSHGRPEEKIDTGSASVVESLNMLEEASASAVAKMALDALGRECGETSFHELALLDGPRIVNALSRAVTHFDTPDVHIGVTNLLAKCLENQDSEAQVVLLHGGFSLLVQIVEETEIARHAFLQEGKRSQTGMTAEDTSRALAAFELACLNARHPCPTEVLAEALTASSSLFVRKTTSEALLQRAQNDEHNDMKQFIPSIMSAASQAAPGSEESLALVKIIAALSVKESNKMQLIRYGCTRHLCLILAEPAVNVGLQMHRGAAKGLANLASSTEDNRGHVMQAMQTLMPPIASFTDSIVNMYLEMVWSS